MQSRTESRLNAFKMHMIVAAVLNRLIIFTNSLPSRNFALSLHRATVLSKILMFPPKNSNVPNFSMSKPCTIVKLLSAS